MVRARKSPNSRGFGTTANSIPRMAYRLQLFLAGWNETGLANLLAPNVGIWHFQQGIYVSCIDDDSVIPDRPGPGRSTRVTFDHVGTKIEGQRPGLSFQPVTPVEL